MDLRDLHPQGLDFSSEDGVQLAAKTFLMRTNFVPAARHILGWRGATDVSLFGRLGWTARIKPCQGVFGLAYKGQEWTGQWRTGTFALYYFPWPGEELIESCSVSAALASARDDYLELLREFPQYPDFTDRFYIARIHLAVQAQEQALFLGLEALSRQRSIAEDGLELLRGKERCLVVKPGECDQDFPAFPTAYAFFQIFAASLTFNLNEPPGLLFKKDLPGQEVHYNDQGHYWQKTNDQLKDRQLYLGYGENQLLNGYEPLAWLGQDQGRGDLVWERGQGVETGLADELWWTAHQLATSSPKGKVHNGIDLRIPFIIVSGFLGSGKTSFIKSFIDCQVQRNRFVAIIQNEIGEVGLDAKLLEDEYAVTEIDEGCVCCTLVGSVKRAVEDILSRYRPDFIVLETTGMANPYNLLEEMIEIEDLVRFDGVTTIVDALNIKKSLADFRLAQNQIKSADIIVVNKTDLVEQDYLTQVKEALRRENNKAPIVTTEYGYINPGLLYGIDLEDTEKEIARSGLSPKAGVHKSHADDGLENKKIRFSKPVDKDRFLSLLQDLPDAIYRIKGTILLSEDRRPHLLQYVNGQFDLSRADDRRFKEQFLILIGRDLDRFKAHDHFASALQGEPSDMD